MAIEVGGKRFVTLSDEFFVNGAKVYEAYANGVKVYPDETTIDCDGFTLNGPIYYFNTVITKMYITVIYPPYSWSSVTERTGGTVVGETDTGFEVVASFSQYGDIDSFPMKIAWYREPNAGYGGEFTTVFASDQPFSSIGYEAWKTKSIYEPTWSYETGYTYWMGSCYHFTFTHKDKTVHYAVSQGDDHIASLKCPLSASNDIPAQVAWYLVYGDHSNMLNT